MGAGKGGEEDNEEKGTMDETKQKDLDPSACVICTETFENDDPVRILPCKHWYHTNCIDPWLLRYSGTCPVW